MRASCELSSARVSLGNYKIRWFPRGSHTLLLPLLTDWHNTTTPGHLAMQLQWVSAYVYRYGPRVRPSWGGEIVLLTTQNRSLTEQNVLSSKRYGHIDGF